MVSLATAADHALAEAKGGVDDDAVAGAGQRVPCERDAGRRGLEQWLNEDTHALLRRVHADALCVRSRALRGERRTDIVRACEHVVDAADVEVGVVDAGEAGALEVLGCGGRADGEGIAAELVQRRGDLVAQSLEWGVAVDHEAVDDRQALGGEIGEGARLAAAARSVARGRLVKEAQVHRLVRHAR